MDSHGTGKTDDPATTETPEDVAVLYSWANLHGAKYRDFSASRREYRAQLRHRAAEQVREQALLAQAEAAAAAAASATTARHAPQPAPTHPAKDSDSSMRPALRDAQRQTQQQDESRPTSVRERGESDPESQGHLSPPAQSERNTSGSRHTSPRRPQGYHPDDGSGVRQIYRGPDCDAMQAEYTST